MLSVVVTEVLTNHEPSRVRTESSVINLVGRGG